MNKYKWRNLKLVICGLISVTSYYFLKNYFNDETNIILLWWTPFMPKFDRIIRCDKGKYKCKVTSNREFKNNLNLGAYMFYGSHIDNNDFPLPRNAPWAIFHEESPKNYAPFLYEAQDLFNITSTFSRNSDFPVTLQYLSNISVITDKKYFIPVHIRNKFLKKISPILYIQSDCDTPIGRDRLVKKLSEYIKIDSYGKCLQNKQFPEKLSMVHPLDLYNTQFLRFISKYKFIIAFENAMCDDYITEKFWRPLIVGAIPIYFGAPNIEDWVPNNRSAILVKDFKNIKSLSKFIHTLNQNNILFESFLNHKLKAQVTNKLLKEKILVEEPVLGFECYVCKKIYENDIRIKKDKKNVYNCPKPIPRYNEQNTWHQHWEIGKCQSKALSILISRGKPYTNEAFQKLWGSFFEERNC